MRLFSCQCCSQILFFENARCERCRHLLGFLAAEATLVALEPVGGDAFRRFGADDGRRFRLCSNARHGVCNWLVEAEGAATLCPACRHNRTIPKLNDPENRLAWSRIEEAKHRLFYTLGRLGLLDAVDTLGGKEPLAFNFLADGSGLRRVMTGHKGGVITIAVSEADDAERERRRKAMNEPYRTLIGHFRHEVGHYFWSRLVRDGGRLDGCRAVFGDDRASYRDALKRHYREGAPRDWQRTHVSAYATSHPWEDFAETFAHYLHIVDTLEMAKAFEMTLAPGVDKAGEFAVRYDADPYRAPDIHTLVKVWLPVSTALNSLNKTMGKDELYPFVLSAAVIEKLGFTHRLIAEATRGVRAAA